MTFEHIGIDVPRQYYWELLDLFSSKVVERARNTVRRAW